MIDIVTKEDNTLGDIIYGYGNYGNGSYGNYKIKITMLFFGFISGFFWFFW